MAPQRKILIEMPRAICVFFAVFTICSATVFFFVYSHQLIWVDVNFPQEIKECETRQGEIEISSPFHQDFTLVGASWC